MNGPDGMEQRTAELDSSYASTERELELRDQAADEARSTELRDLLLEVSRTPAPNSLDLMDMRGAGLRAQRDQLVAALNDIIMGCDMMLQPALSPTGAFASFAREVKRVATAAVEAVS